MRDVLNFIKAESVAADSGRWLEHRAPVSGETILRVPDSNVMDLIQCVQGAQQNSALWLKTSSEDRLARLVEFLEGIRARRTELVDACVDALGTPIYWARLEVDEAFRLAEASLTELREDYQPVEGSRWSRRPWGWVGLILNEEASFSEILARTFAALAAGNLVVLRPSAAHASLIQVLVEVYQETVKLNSVFQVIYGEQSEFVDFLSAHPALRALDLCTGLEETLRIRKGLADQFKPLRALGGSRPAGIVLNDFDLDTQMSSLVEQAYRFHFQPHTRPSRLFVPEKIYEDFVDRFRVAAEEIPSGPLRDEKTRVGPLVGPQWRAKAMEQWQQGLDEKAKPLLSWARSPGELGESFLPPGAFYEFSNCSVLQQVPVYGPLVTITRYKVAQEAVKFANTTPLSGAAHIYGNSRDRMLSIASRLHASHIFINGAQSTADNWGAFAGASAWGFEGTHFQFFSQGRKIFLAPLK